MFLDLLLLGVRVLFLAIIDSLGLALSERCDPLEPTRLDLEAVWRALLSAALR